MLATDYMHEKHIQKTDVLSSDMSMQGNTFLRMTCVERASFWLRNLALDKRLLCWQAIIARLWRRADPPMIAARMRGACASKRISQNFGMRFKSINDAQRA
jgi:hypothetical protein